MRASASDQPTASPRTWRGGVQRPPWTDEAAIRDACTSCGACITKCPEAILIAGPAGTPQLDFRLGECTFCGDCVQACSDGVFRDASDEPWNIIAEISEACLLTNGVECRSCTDFCDSRALRYDFRARPAGKIALDEEACTGCGACVSACPVEAITIKPAPLRSASDEHLRMPRSCRA